MIGYLEGTLLKKEDDRILLFVDHVGYEILLPAVVMEALSSRAEGDQVSLYIYYHQTERQPKPVLIGFNLEDEKEFFKHFISVEAIGPLKAVQALNVPVSEIAEAIERNDVAALRRLKGIGARTAQKIIASLSGKTGRFAVAREGVKTEELPADDFIGQVLDVLINQLGHKAVDARQMIAEAIKRNSEITTPEQLFDEVYRGGALR